MPRHSTQRVPLTAGVALLISAPPGFFRSVTIGNAGTQDLLVYSTPNDDATTFVIAAGWEKPIQLPNESDRFRTSETVCWLKCSVDATAVLIWL